MSLLRTLLRHRLASIGGVVLVAIAGGGFAYVHAGSDPTQYRTTTVTVGTIEQTLSLTGNLSPISQANVNFQVSGTVTGLDVSAGQTVTAGQVLATVDDSTMQAALTQAQASLAAAQAKLAADQSSGSSTTAAQTVATARTNLSNDEVASSDTTAVNAQTVNSDQRTISSDQSTVNSDNQAVAAAQQQFSSDGCSSSSSSSTCQTDTQHLSTAQQQQAKDTQALTTAETSLQNDQVRGREADDQAAARVASDRTALSNALLGGSSSNSSALLQASIAQDNASVAQAEQTVTDDTKSVGDATLLAPSEGTVAAINVSVGSSVGSTSSGTAAGSAASNASSGANFIILTPGAFQVTGTISDSQVNEVAVGQHAVVTAAGTTDGLPGAVTSVGEIATVTSGVATFPVTVQVTGSHPSLRDGMSATISVIINRVVGVLTVPTSAVHTNGTTSTVQVLKNGVASSVVVTTGAADSSQTEIQSGLAAGDTVIIATVTSTIPSTTTTGAGRGLTGGRGGGGFAAAPGG
jgi:multidrug efflux pump subunit AcrA (membrane-fusion protein)